MFIKIKKFWDEKKLLEIKKFKKIFFLRNTLKTKNLTE